MITKEDIEKSRSPRGLRQFVCYRKKKVRQVRSERHAAILRKGIYNYFIKEIVPLSIFALKAYPNSYRVELIHGNQRYDAIVRDSCGNVIDYVELTFPDDWKAEANDAKLIVSRGYGKFDSHSPGEDIDRLGKFIHDVCLKKAKKDYSDCSLVIVIAFWPPSERERHLYSRKIRQILTQVQSISFKAKRVFLLLLEQHKILKVC
ncbi:MAG: hypothetical protein HZC48_08145 [Nitrospirae bacterium]|nr:hypothetical protein [Nitrospirota bacterium]